MANNSRNARQSYRFFTEEDQVRAVETRITAQEADHYRLRLDALVLNGDQGAQDRVTQAERALDALYAERDALRDTPPASDA